MTIGEEREALLTLKFYGWRPLVSLGGIPVAGLAPPGGLEPYCEDELEAVKCLSKRGWAQCDKSLDEAGFRSSVIAPQDRAFEALFRQEPESAQ